MQTYRVDFIENENMDVVTIHKRSIKDCNRVVYHDYKDHHDGLLHIYRLDKDFNEIELVF